MSVRLFTVGGMSYVGGVGGCYLAFYLYCKPLISGAADNTTVPETAETFKNGKVTQQQKIFLDLHTPT